MEKIRLGKSGMEVTKVGFGGIPLQRLSEQRSVEVIRRALDQGIDWIDTAHGYGTSEESIGKALKGYSGIRIFTKGPAQQPEAIREQMELSFKRLEVDVIDLYQFHYVKGRNAWKQMQENGTVDVILEAKREGRIRHIGASAHTKEAALAVLEHPEIEVLQFPFNFIMVEDGEEILSSCRKSQVGLIAMKPFGGGVLSDAEVCVRFFTDCPDVVLDPGFEKAEEVDEVVGLCDAAAGLTEENRRTIERLRRELGTRFCRRCEYCMPCPQGVKITTVMNTESFLKRFPKDRLFSGSFAGGIDSHDNCIECGECEEKCPYDLPIIETMKLWVGKYREVKEEYEREPAS